MIVNGPNIGADGTQEESYNGKNFSILNAPTTATPLSQTQRTVYQGDGLQLQTNGAEFHFRQPYVVTKYTLTGSLSGVSVYDSFNRADSIDFLGFTDTNQEWNEVYGTFGITGNAAFVFDSVTGSDYNLAIVETGFSDCLIKTQIFGPYLSLPLTIGIAFRYDGVNSFAAVCPNDSGYYTAYYVNGTSASPFYYSTNHAMSGDYINVVLNGPNMTLYINNVLDGPDFIIIPFLSETNTKAGLFSWALPPETTPPTWGFFEVDSASSATGVVESSQSFGRAIVAETNRSNGNTDTPLTSAVNSLLSINNDSLSIIEPNILTENIGSISAYGHSFTYDSKNYEDSGGRLQIGNVEGGESVGLTHGLMLSKGEIPIAGLNADTGNFFGFEGNGGGGTGGGISGLIGESGISGLMALSGISGISGAMPDLTLFYLLQSRISTGV